MAARIRHHAARIDGLVDRRDLVLDPADPEAGGGPEGAAAAGMQGMAWCPTPSALRRLAEAGAHLPAAPSLAVLQRVLHRRFSAGLGDGLGESLWIEGEAELAGALEEATRRAGPGATWVLKRGYGFAARGHRRFLPGAPGDSLLAFARTALAQDGGVLIEPWRERLADFGLHGWLGPDGALVRGSPTTSIVDAHGTWVESRIAAPGELGSGEEDTLREALERAAAGLRCAGYFGAFGIDAYRFRAEGGRIRFQPLSEVNARFSMGWAVGMGASRPHRSRPGRNPAGTIPTPEEPAMIRALADQYWQETLASSPTTATALGDRRYDDKLSDLSPEARTAEIRMAEELMGKVRAVDEAGLSPADRLTRGELIGHLSRDLAMLRAGIDEWIVSPLSGPQNSYMNLPEIQPLRSEDELAAYLGRVRAMPFQLGQRIDGLRRCRVAGKVANHKAVARVLSQLAGILAKKVGEWTLARHAKAAAETLGTPSAQALAGEVEKALATGLQPALRGYREMLSQEILPAARPDDRPGLVHVPDGHLAYQAVLQVHTSLGISAEEIHRIGLEEMARIQDELSRVASRAFGISDLPGIQARLRTDPGLYFDTAEAIEAKARDAVERARGAIPKWFGRLPKAECQVRPIPEHEAPDSTIAYYRGPATDGSRPGVYYVNTYAPTTRPRYEAEVLAFHEAIPGHHLQIAIAQELEAMPEFRKHGGVTAYLEGWALYTERLSDEMGLYGGDLDRIGALSFDAWRAARLVVDTGLHALGWSRQQAIDYMLANTVLAANNIENEVDRYVVMPGQAVSYKIGQHEILRLRREAEERLGDRFDLASFHDCLLGDGAVGLEVLGSQVQAWIAARSGA